MAHKLCNRNGYAESLQGRAEAICSAGVRWPADAVESIEVTFLLNPAKRKKRSGLPAFDQELCRRKAWLNGHREQRLRDLTRGWPSDPAAEQRTVTALLALLCFYSTDSKSPGFERTP